MGNLKWDYDSCLQESKKYKSRSEYKLKSNTSYHVARKNGWLDDYIWFNTLSYYGDNAQKSDNIYVYEFKELKSVYIGRTIQPKERDISHRHSKTSSVFKFAKENNIDIPHMKILISNITILEGRKLEKEVLENYKNENWNIINKAKCGEGCGSLGGLYHKWSKNKCFEIAKTCLSKSEFKYKNNSAYNSARKNGWLNDYTWFENPHVKWTKEKCFEESKKYTSRSEFKNGCVQSYNISLKNGWLDEMIWLKYKDKTKYNIYWTKEKIINVAKNCKNLTDFFNNYTQAYRISKRNGYLYELFPKKE